jgi:DNA-binding XRE family transcriptional regulator
MGANVRLAREKTEMKPEILAQHLGLTRSSIINIEKGRHKPALHTLLEISNLLKVHYTKLIPESRKKEITLDVKDMVNVITDANNINKETEQAFQKFITSINKQNKS